MPHALEATAVVPLTLDEAFALAHTLGDDRTSWDNSVEKRMLLRDSTRLGLGAHVFERVRNGRRVILEYDVWYPGQVSSARMVKGPFWLGDYGEGWHFSGVDGGTRVTAKVTYRHAAKLLEAPVGAAMKFSFRTELDARMDDYINAARDIELVRRAVSSDLPLHARHRNRD